MTPLFDNSLTLILELINSLDQKYCSKVVNKVNQASSLMKIADAIEIPSKDVPKYAIRTVVTVLPRLWPGNI